jgi:hypothetical protein
MRGNPQVRFLGGRAEAIPPGYPAARNGGMGGAGSAEGGAGNEEEAGNAGEEKGESWERRCWSASARFTRELGTVESFWVRGE